MKNLLFVGIAVLVGCLVLPAVVAAATYYVDPYDGSDSNPGSQPSTAWRSIPGTCTPDNGAYAEGQGWVKIKAGDTILLKSGTVIRARVAIDEKWYENGTADLHIRIARDPSWGSGPVVFDGTGQALGGWDGLVSAIHRHYLEIDGSGPGGIVIQNSAARGFAATGLSEADKMRGLTVRNVKLFNNMSHNVYLQQQDSFLIESIEIDGNRQPQTGGLYIGDQGFGCSNGRVVRCTSYNNGVNPGAQAGWTDLRIGFWCTNSTNVVFDGCTAHDNEGRGFDVGTVSNPPSTVPNNIVYLNCVAYNNSMGFGCNLDDVAGEANFWYLNCIAHHNGAGWDIYQGPSVYVYNCLSASNGHGFYLDTAQTFSRWTKVVVVNTIIYDNRESAIYAHDGKSLYVFFDHNLYEQGDGADSLIRWDGVGQGNHGNTVVYTYTSSANINAWREQQAMDRASRDSFSDGCHARFVDPGANNYHLQASSDARVMGANLTSQWPMSLPTADKAGLGRSATDVWGIGPYLYTDGPTSD